ncbi:MAG: hypothetical protein HC896_08645 [Bacteroidales bacterium]|nr:hypothetical protein [Bacteroidales bacterium]
MAVKKALEAKYKVGLFEDPYKYFDEEREKNVILSQEHIDKTKQMALKSMVLLKNSKELLPLDKNVKTLGIIGPFAKSKQDLLGWWACMGKPEETTSVFEGIAKHVSPGTNILYAPGCVIDSFRLAGEELIAPAVNVAKKADAVIVVLGEAYWMSGEGGGTAALHLPGLQEKLVAELAKTGKPIITVLVNGRPYVVTDIVKNSDAVLEAWMPGTTGGDAVAEILFGQFNPCGKLPVTFPMHEGQVPIYYDYHQSSHDFNGPGRYIAKHLDVPHEPLFPFGFGLSYTTYSYDSIALSDTVMQVQGSIKATVKVTNTGNYEGTETVQMYIRDKVCSVTRPVKQLKGFKLLTLKPGETKEAVFEITKDELMFLDAELKKSVEPGEFRLFIGPNSADLKEADFVLL